MFIYLAVCLKLFVIAHFVAAAPKLPTVSPKLNQFIKGSYADWKPHPLAEIIDNEREFLRTWITSKGNLTLHITALPSETEAEMRLKIERKLVSGGAPGGPVELGNEGYVYPSDVAKDGPAVLRFRRGNFYIYLSGQTVGAIERIAKEVDRLVQGKTPRQE
jgi:hypothetical protein